MRERFNIKYRKQIEDKSLQVVTGEGNPVEIIKWDLKCNEYPIVAVVQYNNLDTESVERYTLNGDYYSDKSTKSLDLWVTDEDIFEDILMRKKFWNAVSECMHSAYGHDDVPSNDSICEWTDNLLNIAREVIEHEASTKSSKNLCCDDKANCTGDDKAAINEPKATPVNTEALETLPNFHPCD